MISRSDIFQARSDLGGANDARAIVAKLVHDYGQDALNEFICQIIEMVEPTEEARLAAIEARLTDLERRMYVPPELVAELEKGAHESEAWRADMAALRRSRPTRVPFPDVLSGKELRAKLDVLDAKFDILIDAFNSLESAVKEKLGR
jgi:hypothetical protein